MTQFIQVVTAIDSEDKAAAIGRALVERRLAGCCQVIGPVQSVYRWQEKIETAVEWQIVIKSSREKWPALEAAIKELHSYETPEILMFEIVEGSKEYLDWLRKQVE